MKKKAMDLDNIQPPFCNQNKPGISGRQVDTIPKYVKGKIKRTNQENNNQNLYSFTSKSSLSHRSGNINYD